MLPEQTPNSAANTTADARTFTVSVNDELPAVADTTTLSVLLDELALGTTKGVAVAINNAVVVRSHWRTHRLADGDRVLIIQAIHGR